MHANSKEEFSESLRPGRSFQVSLFVVTEKSVGLFYVCKNSHMRVDKALVRNRFRTITVQQGQHSVSDVLVM